MRNAPLNLIGAILISTLFTLASHAQAYSPRRLTRRVAPQTAPPAQNNAPAPAPQPAAPQPAVAQPAPAAPPVQIVQPPVDPAQVKAEHEEAAKKAIEFRKKREAEEAEAAKKNTDAKQVLQIVCKPVKPDPTVSLQFVDLSLTNLCSKPISRVTMHFVYFDATGLRLKDWTTRRDLDQPLPGNQAMVLSEPAYFMPLGTKKIQIDPKEVRFADGTEWDAPVN
jgi:hypothetical protein